MTDAPIILGPNGQPLAAPKDKRCPGILPSGFACLAGPEKRVASGGFGMPHPVCRVCGHEFKDERWYG